MSLKCFLKNSRQGFTLVQTMVAAGLVGGLALVIMQTIDKQSLGLRVTEQDLVISETIAEARMYLANPESCENSVRDLDPSRNESLIIKNKFNVDRFFEGQELGAGVKLDQLNLSGVTSTSEDKKTHTSVVFSFVTKQKNKIKKIEKNLKIQGRLNEKGQFIDCSSFDIEAIQNARRLACQDLGGDFDTAREQCFFLEGTELKASVCRAFNSSFDESKEECTTGFFKNLKQSCPPGSVLTGIYEDGLISCQSADALFVVNNCLKGLEDPDVGFVDPLEEGERRELSCGSGFSGKKSFQCLEGEIKIVSNTCARKTVCGPFNRSGGNYCFNTTGLRNGLSEAQCAAHCQNNGATCCLRHVKSRQCFLGTTKRSVGGCSGCRSAVCR